MQAIIWLDKKITTAFLDITILVCDIDADTLQVIMPLDTRVLVSYDHIMLAPDVTASADFLLKKDGEYLAGVVDCRA